jgi:hypothetical protein
MLGQALPMRLTSWPPQRKACHLDQHSKYDLKASQYHGLFYQRLLHQNALLWAKEESALARR